MCSRFNSSLRMVDMLQQKPIYISVLVPVYNVPEKLLKRCLDSLLQQTLMQSEFILVDDGSSDNSGQICEEYAKKDSRMIVIHQENKGLSAARNTAFSLARGSYIMFLDGDDYIEPQTCALAWKIADEKNVDVVFWNIQTEYAHSSTITKPFTGESKGLTPEEVNNLQKNVLDFNAKIAQVFAKIVNREILINNKIFHEEELRQGAEGIVFNFKLFANVKSAYYLNKTFNHYVYNEQSISHLPNLSNYYLIVRCFTYIRKLTQQKSFSNKEELFKLIDVRLLYVIITTAISGFFNPANKLSYSDKVLGFENFLKEDIIKHALTYGDRSKVSRQRRLVLWLIDHKIFFSVQILAWLRKLQYKNR